jgi:hypothetical protein
MGHNNQITPKQKTSSITAHHHCECQDQQQRGKGGDLFAAAVTLPEQ